MCGLALVVISDQTVRAHCEFEDLWRCTCAGQNLVHQRAMFANGNFYLARQNESHASRTLPAPQGSLDPECACAVLCTAKITTISAYLHVAWEDAW
jgi:hypothetical protein